MEDTMINKLVAYTDTVGFNGAFSFVRSLDEVAEAIGVRTSELEAYFCDEDSEYWGERDQGPFANRFADYFTDANGYWIEFCDTTVAPPKRG